jgi:hypothetical protein
MMQRQVVAVGVDTIVGERLDSQAIILALANLLTRKQHGDGLFWSEESSIER